MGPRVSAGVQPVRKLFLGVLGLTALYVGVEGWAQGDRRSAAIDVGNGVKLPDDGIALNSGSHISVRRTRKAVIVQVLQGEALLNARESGSRPLVVRAGNAQVRDFNAVVCVGMDGDRASVDVIDGVARVANVDAENRVINELTLRAGDRAEIAVSGAFVSFRIAGSGVGEREPCRWGAK